MKGHYRQRLSYLVAFATLVPAASGAASGTDACRPAPGTRVVYVDRGATGANDGSSWGNAFTDLGAALAAAAASTGGDQLWIAKGTYATPAGEAFVLPSDTRLYGGFRGGERRLRDRDPQAAPTVLSGAGNARHVVFTALTAGVSIDGLSVTGGAATGDLALDALDVSNQVRGGGLLALDAEVALCNAVFRGNRARKFGGAVYQRGGSLRVQNSTFADNSVLRGPDEVHDEDAEADTDGGAIAIHAAAVLEVRESLFSGNVAGDDGGAIAARDIGDSQLLTVRFYRNKGIARVQPIMLAPGGSAQDILISTMGGAVQLWNEYAGFNNGDQSRHILVKDCEFVENQGAIAAGAYIESTPGSVTVVEGSKFLRNGGNGQADPGAPANEQGVAFGRSGGALMIVGLRWGDREEDSPGHYLRPQHKAFIRACTFADNEAGYAGAVQLLGVDGEVEHTAFLRNVGRQRGGALLASNVFSLFDQFNGLRPGFGAVRVDHALFVGNRALGMPESLLSEEFPGLMTDLEQPTGGGAIFSEAGYDLVVSDSTFLDNSAADGDGGAIHNAAIHLWFFVLPSPPAPTDYGATLSVVNSRFVGNKTLGAGAGGALANGGSQADGRSSDAFGNDVRDTAAVADVSIVGSIFEGNSAAGGGGALANWNSSASSVAHSRFVANSAAAGGGAVGSVGRAAAPATLNLDHCIVGGNSAGGPGGGVYARDSGGAITGSRIVGNTPTNVDWEP